MRERCMRCGEIPSYWHDDYMCQKCHEDLRLEREFEKAEAIWLEPPEPAEPDPRNAEDEVQE